MWNGRTEDGDVADDDVDDDKDGGGGTTVSTLFVACDEPSSMEWPSIGRNSDESLLPL